MHRSHVHLPDDVQPGNDPEHSCRKQLTCQTQEDHPGCLWLRPRYRINKLTLFSLSDVVVGGL